MGITETLNSGRTLVLFNGTLSGSGTELINFITHCDTFLLSVFVRSTSGDIDIAADVLHATGESDNVVTFPTLSAATTELVLKKAAVALGNAQLQIAYTGECDLRIVAKGLSVGDLSAQLVGAASLRATKVSPAVGTTPQLLVAAALDDRAGILIKNYDSNRSVFLAETGPKTLTDGYPLDPKESLGIDVAAGEEVWIVGEKIGMDVRILEGGL
jgi:hypothetical protein